MQQKCSDRLRVNAYIGMGVFACAKEAKPHCTHNKPNGMGVFACTKDAKPHCTCNKPNVMFHPNILSTNCYKSPQFLN